MVQMKYFGDSRDYFKYDLITQIIDDMKIENYVFVPMLTKHRIDNEGNKTPKKSGGKSDALLSFMQSCALHSLNHWKKWLNPHVANYITAEPVDEIYFEDNTRDQYWAIYEEPLKKKTALIFLDPDTGLQSGSNSYLKKNGRDKYILDNEIKSLHDHLESSSILMIYQHLPPNKNDHKKSVTRKMKQLSAANMDSFVCGYREDDLVFLFLTKDSDRFNRLYETLKNYHSKSEHMYKSLHALSKWMPHRMKAPYVMRWPGEDYGRVIEFLFPHESGGLCFIDVGRGLTSFTHPFHVIEEPVIQKSDRWALHNGAVIQQLLRTDREWTNWQCWLDFRASPEGTSVEDASTMEALKRNGAIME